MSTRGCVAIGTAAGWEGGRYVEKNGQALPIEVWTLLRKPDGMTRFERLLAEHGAGFYQFPNECFCHMTDERARAHLYPDGVSRDEIRLDPRSADEMGVEVACVLEVATRTLHIFEFNEFDHPKLATSLSIDGPEPDWNTIFPF